MITVHKRTSRGFVFPLSKSECLELASALLEVLDLEEGELELCLVDDVEMSSLHERHLGGVGPTNVLAFPSVRESFADEETDEDSAFEVDGADDAADEETGWADAPDLSDEFTDAAPDFVDPLGDGDFDSVVHGSIVFSVDALRRECVLYDQDPQQYFARLLAHALLHLTGVPHGEFMEERMDLAVEQVLEG